MGYVLFSVLLSTFSCLAAVGGSNILFMTNVPSPSHGLWNYRLVNGLASRGHNITMLSPNKPSTIHKNVHVISMADLYQRLIEYNISMAEFVENDSLQIVELYAKMIIGLCHLVTGTEGFKMLLNYPDNFRFDLIMYDFTAGGCLLGFLHKFKYPPLIGVTPYKFSSEVVDIAGGHSFPAYIPRPPGTYNINMNYFQRVQNTMGIIYEIYVRQKAIHPMIHDVMSPYFKNLPSILELEHKVALVLLNTHPSTDFPVPLPPNVIEVGGLQIADPKPLPEDLLTFVNSSSSGTVMISFGTNVLEDIFGAEKQKIVVDTVKKFPSYNFLWKFDKDMTNGEVPNLIIRPWLPQSDILAHPKVKAFVTHNGALSTHEATYHGVPMVSVPFFADQLSNARESVLAGVALKVDVSSLSVKSFETALRKILEDQTFTDRIKLRSLRFKDRIMKPLDTAIWWVEYILRDPNPTHLRSPVLDLGHLKANSVDLVVDFVLISLMIAGLAVYLSIKVWRYFRGTSNDTKVKTS